MQKLFKNNLREIFKKMYILAHSVSTNLCKNKKIIAFIQFFTDVKKYDEDLIKLGFRRQFQLGEKVAEYFPNVEERKNLKILDIAAGTGLAGMGLYKQGFKNLDAVGNIFRFFLEYIQVNCYLCTYNNLPRWLRGNVRKIESKRYLFTYISLCFG